jgi:hypothetical protein
MAEEHVVPSHRFRFRGESGLFSNLQQRAKKLSTTQVVLLAAGGVLVIEHLIAPRGMSYASKLWGKVAGSHPLPPPPPPVPVIPPAAAKGFYFEAPPEAFETAGDYAGANLQAGWNRGMTPYGPWASGDPMRQYAHADQRRLGSMYDWE